MKDREPYGPKVASEDERQQRTKERTTARPFGRHFRRYAPFVRPHILDHKERG